MGFPPLKGNRPAPPAPRQTVETKAEFSTGGGGLKVSKAIKNAAIKPSPGIEKVNSAS